VMDDRVIDERTGRKASLRKVQNGALELIW